MSQRRIGSAAKDACPDRSTVVAELRQQLSPPFDVPVVVMLNAVLMIGAWFELPRAWLFAVTGPAAFPLLLASWMYADSPATNVLASGRLQSLAALQAAEQSAQALSRLLGARQVALWLIVSVPCLLAAVVVGLVDHRPIVTAATVVGILALPLGPLTLAGCVGLLLPYHPLRLRTRWSCRRQWRGQVRWAALVVTPYLVVPSLLTVTTLPSTALWRALGPPPSAAIADGELAALVLLACATSVGLAVVGHRLTVTIIDARRVALVSFLEATPCSSPSKPPSSGSTHQARMPPK